MFPVNCYPLIIIVVIFNCIVTIESRAFDPDRSCHQRGCQETSLNECSRRGHSWASFTAQGVQTCLCCFDEKDALQAAGVNEDNEVGHFFGNVLRVCESLHVDEGHCRSRESRDCNFIPAFKGTNYLGCFYCRPRCDHESDCQDLGRTCDLSKNGQPVRSCTGTGSGYIPGFDDPREYETAIKKNYLIHLKNNRTKPADSPSTPPHSTTSTTTTTTTTTTMLPITSLRPLLSSQSTKNHHQPQSKPTCYPGKSGSTASSLCSSSSPSQTQQSSFDEIKTSSADSSSFKKPYSSIKKRPQSQQPQPQQHQETTPSKVNNDVKFNQPLKTKPSYKPYPTFQPTKTPSWSSITQQQQQQQQVQPQQPQVDQEPSESSSLTDHDSGAVNGESMSVNDDDAASWGSPSSHTSNSDEEFELGRSPHPHGKPNMVHPVSGSPPSHRTTTTTISPIFKPTDLNETLFVVKNNHRQIHG
ncbi:probable serine/threonine-protein kinase samkC [Panonychus citri]|uniref:probable serine/threonine-protein kinase samkC n=1 Tax=Panonychus citri TaxID=50023 RepID=UPI00230734F9|nr:probable serine/threonine-protein kinase samkC [Panonychus citri]